MLESKRDAVLQEDLEYIDYDVAPIDADIIIVDEVSMVDAALMSSLLKAMPRDCKLILVGDKDQLPSVGAGNVLADILGSDIVKVCMLKKIFLMKKIITIIFQNKLSVYLKIFWIIPYYTTKKASLQDIFFSFFQKNFNFWKKFNKLKLKI